MSCCDGWGDEEDKKLINGNCPDCGFPTIDGKAWEGCNYSPVECETCGSAPCDGSC